MKVEDLHDKVQITLTFKEAEAILVDLDAAEMTLELNKPTVKLLEKLDEYTNT